MLGYISSSNDVYVFFENCDIDELEMNTVKGTHFNVRNPQITGLLEVSIDDKISNRMTTAITKDIEGNILKLHLQIMSRDYLTLKEDRFKELHEGYRHICLRDATRLDELHLFDQMNYFQLKHYQSKYC